MESIQKAVDRQVVLSPPHKQRQSVTSRRAGYLVALVINAGLLYLINRSPGWQSVPFLSDDTPDVLGLVNASIVAVIVGNTVYMVWDPRWLRAVGDIVTTSLGLSALVALWNVFPFTFGSAAIHWEVVTRCVIGVGIAGSIIGIIAAVIRLTQPFPVLPCATSVDGFRVADLPAQCAGRGSGEVPSWLAPVVFAP